mmetsp:Transcript_10952/g.16850  ORF Transcript_10952/g.16850 Transcript_10952/m.16850 type:complete len:239 (-) Transcript_10952:215-931(-)
MTEVLQNPLPNASHQLAFSVIRVPFFLEPDYDETRPFIESNRDRLIKKWGGKQGWERQKASHDLKGRGLDAGIPHFNLDRLTGNTMASHRLIQHIGKNYGLATSEAIYDVLNEYYFVNGHSLNDRSRLAKTVALELEKVLTEEEAPSAEDLLSFLNSNEGRKEIEAALAGLREIGVHSIPKFIIAGRTLIDGAAHASTFIEVFRKIERRGKIHAGPVFAEVLGLRKEIIEKGSHHAQA